MRWLTKDGCVRGRIPESTSTYRELLYTQYPVPGTQYPVPGTQYQVPSTQYPVPGTQYPVPRSSSIRRASGRSSRVLWQRGAQRGG